MSGTGGRMSVEFTVWCGCRRCDCQDWLALTAKSRRDAFYEAKGRGWNRSRAFGWLCEECDVHECRPTTEAASATNVRG